MKDFSVCRAHVLGEQECAQKAEQLLEQLVQRMGGRYESKGDTFVYHHTSGVKAFVSPSADELKIDVKLSLLTRAFGPMLNEEINRQLDKYFV